MFGCYLGGSVRQRLFPVAFSLRGKDTPLCVQETCHIELMEVSQDLLTLM